MNGFSKSEAKTEIEKDSPCLYKLDKNESFGRHLVATQDISAGTLILKENPVIIEPLDPNEDFDPFDEYDFGPIAFSCILCCREMRSLLVCSQCHLPICSPKCSESPNHRNFECKIFKGDTLLNTQTISPMVMYPAISIMRGMIIKGDNSDLWSKIENLQAKPAKTSKNKSKSYHDAMCELVDYDFNNFKNCFRFRKKKVKFVENKKDWKKIGGIMNINGFSLDFNFDNHINMTRVRNLYIESSMLANGCFPNCTWSLGPGPTFTMEIWSAVDISKGEPLTIMYSKNATLVGSLERQILSLQQSNTNLDFFCLCSRCVDPTENGTMFSAVKCDCLAPNGFILSSNPRKLHSDWVCQNDECKIIKSWKEIQDLNDKYKDKIESIHYNDLKPGFIENFNTELLKKFGPNHYLIFTLARTVVQLIDTRTKNPNDVYIPDLYISMAKNVDQVYDMIMPGLQLQKSIVKMKLYKALLEKYQKDVANDTKKENFYSLTHQLVEIFKVQNEIWELHRRDPSYRDNITKFVTDMESNEKVLNLNTHKGEEKVEEK